MVWDRLVRTTHWLNASLFLLGYFVFEEGEDWHRWAGYALVASTFLRIVWGFTSTGPARFSHFFPRSKTLQAHLSDLKLRPFSRGGLHYTFDHNPLAALMCFFLWFALLSTALSGWLLTLDYFWGSEVMEVTHEWAANVTLFAAGCHVLAVGVMSYWYNKNLLKAMLWSRSGSQSSATENGIQEE